VTVAARIAVAVVAAAVLAWLGVMERDARLQARGIDALRGNRDLAAAESDLRAARTLNPDTTPDINRALVHQARGDVRGAGAIIDDVLRREPDNLLAWGIRYVLARGTDPAAARRALAAQRRLDPLSARRG
jgi:hypothetical protein